MPKQVTDLRDFIEKAKRADAKVVKIKKATKAGGATKFKVRCSRFLYTLKIADAEKAEKLAQSLPPGLTKKEI